MKAAFLLLIMASSGAAQAPRSQQPPAWLQEPTSFLGIRFGQPLRTSMSECPKHVDYFGQTQYDWPGLGRPCFGIVDGFLTVYNLHPFFDITVIEIGGNVQNIECKFNNGNAGSLATVDAKGIASTLIEKFGLPQVSRVKTLSTQSGAQYENQVLIWRGENVEIDFDSVAGEFNHGRLSAYTAVYAAFLKSQNDQNRDQLKGIF